MCCDLNTVWFILVGVLLTGYVILDGFDLGVGMLHLFTKKDSHRRTLLNAIGPVWDGNEVWLLTGGGALFAAFPEVYATAFSGLYLPLMLVLLALILRAASIEFRSKVESESWKRAWDTTFSLGSWLAALLFGVAIANIARGLPIDANHEYAGGFFNLLNPFALVIGVMTLALLMLHGALYLSLKVEGELLTMVSGWINKLWRIYAIVYVAGATLILFMVPRFLSALDKQAAFSVLRILSALAVIAVFFFWKRGKPFAAFLSSCVNIALLMTLFGAGMYPDLIYALNDPTNSLTITNAASSSKTLSVMLVIALIGMPLVIAYTAVIYRVFREKVKLDGNSY